MMRITSCDRCGYAEADRSGIAGREFEYQGKWYTLMPEFRFRHPDHDENVVDVCGTCYSELMNALIRAKTEAEKKKLETYRRLVVGVTATERPTPNGWWARWRARIASAFGAKC